MYHMPSHTVANPVNTKETNGVTVATLGNNDDFPAFFTPTSGYKVILSMSTINYYTSLIVTLSCYLNTRLCSLDK